MKLLSVIGTRPQYVKASAIAHALRDYPAITPVMVDSGQHYDENLSDIFLRELDIPAPDYNLAVGSQSHAAQTAAIMQQLDPILVAEKPDWLLVYGDTNTTLAAALTAVKRHIPIAHIEAGLRVGNRAMPEEINRIVTDHISTLLFVPTERGVEQLRAEGIAGPQVVNTGDVMYNVALRFRARAQSESRIIDRLKLTPGHHIAATIHRAEHTDHPAILAAIVAAFEQLAAHHRIILPLHPRTRQALLRDGLLLRLQACVTLIEPLGYIDMAMLTSQARLVVTDSGGLQREAFFYQVPCVNLNAQIFWPEIDRLGWSRTVGTLDTAAILAVAQSMLEMLPPAWSNPFGDEKNVHRLLDALVSWPPA